MDLCYWLQPGTLKDNKLAPELIWLHQHGLRKEAEGCTCFCGVGMCIILLHVKLDLTDLYVWQNEGLSLLFVRSVSLCFVCCCWVTWWQISRSRMTHREDSNLCAVSGPDHSALTVFQHQCSRGMFLFQASEFLPRYPAFIFPHLKYFSQKNSSMKPVS